MKRSISITGVIILILSITACNWNSFSETADVHEQNDSFSDAAYITDGSHMAVITANFFDDAYDYYLMDLSGSVTLNINIAVDQITETTLTVYSANNTSTVVATDSAGDADYDNTVTIANASGQYYVLVKSNNGNNYIINYKNN